MITLQTGLPGHSKTLHVLWQVAKYVEQENKRLADEALRNGTEPLVRQVFYSGIKGVTLPWVEIDPKDWNSCPTGSIIIIDECQFVFPCMPNGAKRPAMYTDLATHRHKGYDFFLLTQDPGLLDSFVRKLCERHWHQVRKFGMQRATVYTWDTVQTAPRSPQSIKVALSSQYFVFPKEVYGWYKSAEVHTVRRRIPAKLVFAVLFVISVPILGYFALKSYSSRFKPDSSAVSVAAPLSSSPGVRSGSGPAGAPLNPVDDAKQFVYANTPRVLDLPQTAPKYDQLTKPVRVPVPAMCVKRGNRCQCYSQQATKMNVSFNTCVDIAYNGYFEDFDRDPNAMKSQQDLQKLPPVLASSQLPTSAPAVVYIPHIPDPPPTWKK